jgi:hypothetical protein
MTRCFVCNRIKEEKSNQWWALYLSLSMPSSLMSLTIAPLAAVAGVDGSSYKPACGNNCSQKIVERWLTTRTMDAPRAAGESA